MLGLYLAEQHQIEILGITCVAGNGTLENVVGAAQLTMIACGNAKIPIYRGLEPFDKGNEESEYFWGPDGFGNALTEYKDQGFMTYPNVREDETAVEFLIRASKEHSGEITLISIAPSSNIAAAVMKDSEFSKRIRNVVIMGGTYLAQGNTDYYSSEFNFFKDPESTKILFDSFDDITMVPVEATYF